jgi:thiosulfate/3-mercaptopyruvate sulfurtransferase
MTLRLLSIASLCALGLANAADLLVSTEWLANHLRDESLVILHVGSQKDYDEGHIPGARLVSVGDISVTGENGLRVQLPPVAALEETFGKLGIGDGAHVIIYAGIPAPQAATRVWFTLDALGWGDRASLLDGGFPLWRSQNRAVSTEAPAVTPRKFTAKSATDRVVTAAWVRDHLKDSTVQILDARTPEFYSGANAGNMPRAGHIPGARNVPFIELFQDDGTFKPEASLRQMFKSGGQPSATVSYCHIGMQASVVYFVARYLGLPARLYDGSFQEWSSQPALPLE